MFSAREFLARQLGCQASELDLRDPRLHRPDGSDTQAYDWSGALAGRVMVTGPRRNIGGETARLAVAVSAGGPTGYHQIGPDEEVSW
jgi:hypothetical protein